MEKNKTQEFKVLFKYSQEQGNYDAWFQKAKQEAESIVGKLNKQLEDYWIKNKKGSIHDWEVSWIAKYEPAAMRWYFLLEHQSCGTIIAEWKPSLTWKEIDNWLQNHKCNC